MCYAIIYLEQNDEIEMYNQFNWNQNHTGQILGQMGQFGVFGQYLENTWRGDPLKDMLMYPDDQY